MSSLRECKHIALSELSQSFIKALNIIIIILENVNTEIVYAKTSVHCCIPTETSVKSQCMLLCLD